MPVRYVKYTRRGGEVLVSTPTISEERARALAARFPTFITFFDEAESLFDEFGGYYSVLFGGIEYARFAPSNEWSAYAELMKSVPDFSYVFIKTEEF